MNANIAKKELKTMNRKLGQIKRHHNWLFSDRTEEIERLEREIEVQQRYVARLTVEDAEFFNDFWGFAN